MANQGTISGSTNYSAGGSMICLHVQANWVQQKDTANNKSLVTVQYQAKQTRGVYFSQACSYGVYIDGSVIESINGELRAMQSGAWTTCWERTYTIPHDASGNASFALRITGSFSEGNWHSGVASVPSSGSETITLDQIIAPTPPPDPDPEYIVITRQPENIENCNASASIEFSVAATHVASYQWQQSTDGGTTWANMSGKTASSLGITTSKAAESYLYRCHIVGTGGDTQNTNAVGFSLKKISITATPKDVNCNEGATATFAVSASNVASYQWQVRTDATWSNISGATGASLQVTATRASESNRYRCHMTGLGADEVYTNEVRYILPAVLPRISITAQPSNVSCNAGDSATFSVTASNVSSYQWQSSTNSGASWTNISGATSSSLVITASSANASTLYRCYLTGTGGDTACTNSVKTVLPGPITITSQPANVWCNVGDAITFTVTATNAASYSWEVSVDGGSYWSTANVNPYTGALTNTLRFSATNSRVTYLYRCQITGKGGDTKYSNAVRFYLPATISSSTASILINGTNTLTVDITKPSGTTYCEAEFTLAGYTSGPLTMDGTTTQKTFTVPVSWAAAVAANGSATGTVTVRSYKFAGRSGLFGTATASWTAKAICTIATVTQSVALNTAIAVNISRPGGAIYAASIIALGSQSYTLNLDNKTSGSYTIPVSWGQQFTTAKSKTGTVTLITYTAADHTTEVGRTAAVSWTCTAPSSFGPTAGGTVMWIEGGSFDYSTGADQNTANTRVRSGYIRYNNTGEHNFSAGIQFKSGWSVSVGTYNTDGTFVSATDFLNGPYPTTSLSGDHYYRFRFRKGDGSGTLTPAMLLHSDSDTSVWSPLKFAGTGGWQLCGWATAYPFSTNNTVEEWGFPVAGYSKLHIVVDDSHPNTVSNWNRDPIRVNRATGAYIRAAYASISGKTYTLTKSGNYWTGDTDFLPTAGTQDLRVWVEDSRGYTCAATYKPIVYAYRAPRATDVSVFRCNSSGVRDEMNGKNISIKATLNVNSVAGRNDVTALEYRYIAAGGTWTSWASLTSGTASVVGGDVLDKTKTYTVEIRAVDELNTNTYSFVVQSALALIHAPAGGKRLGVGRFYDSTLGDNWVDLGMSLRIGDKLAFLNPDDIPYWNLGKEGVELVSGTDLNDIYVPGNYYCELDATVSSILHRPQYLSIAFSMKVYKSRGVDNDMIQEIVSYWGTQVWRRVIRLYNNGTFKDTGEWFYWPGTQVTTITT